MSGDEQIHGSYDGPALLKECSYLPVMICCHLVVRNYFKGSKKRIQCISVLLDVAAFCYSVFQF